MSRKRPYTKREPEMDFTFRRSLPCAACGGSGLTTSAPAVPSDPAEPSAALALVDRLIGDNTKLDASRPVTYADLRQLRAALRTASSAPAREQVEALPSYEYTEDCMELVSDGSPGHSFKGKWIERGAVLALFPAAARSPSPEKAR